MFMGGQHKQRRLNMKCFTLILILMMLVPNLVGQDQFSNLFKQILPSKLTSDLEKATNLKEAVLLISSRVDKELTPDLLEMWLYQCEKEISSFTWGGKKFKQLSTRNQLNALGSYLAGDKKFLYKDMTSPEPYLLSHLLKTGQGNCSTLPIAFCLLAQKLELPVYLVQRPRHAFARYDATKHTGNENDLAGWTGFMIDMFNPVEDVIFITDLVEDMFKNVKEEQTILPIGRKF